MADKYYTEIAKQQEIGNISIPFSFKKELFRKSIHSLIAIIPFIAAFNKNIAIILLIGGIVIYCISEFFRKIGLNQSFLSAITQLAVRESKTTSFDMGPVTLGIGAVLSLIIFPPAIASFSLFALAFGDGIASIAGKLFPSFSIPFTKGKTFTGSMACFICIYLVAFKMTVSMPSAFLLAIAGTAIEALPLKAYDNIALPVGVGFIASVLQLI